MTKVQYLYSLTDEGATIVEDPKRVAEKIIKTIETLDLDRFFLHLPIGSMPHEDVLRAIELYGTEVAPIVREYFAKKEENQSQG